MKIYQDFDGLKIQDENLAIHFLQPNMAVIWANGIIRNIAKWIAKKHDKTLWEVVRYVSWKRGVIKKSLARELFAKMVFTFCREVLQENETPSKIHSSMAHCLYVYELKNCEEQHFSEELKHLITTIEAFFDDNTPPNEPAAPTIKDRLEVYLRNIVVEQLEKYPYQRIRLNPDYGNDIIPDIAIEKYQNKEFLNLDKPSYIEAYVCIEEPLSKDKLHSFISLYGEKRNIKLYIVSTYGISNDVYTLADKKEVGYVLVNPKKEVTNNSYILPRTIEDYTSMDKYCDMLFGQVEVGVPMIICDGTKICTSLADSLISHGIAIQSVYELHVPVLKNDEIESIADKLTDSYVQYWLEFLRKVKGNLYKENTIPIRKRKDGHNYVEMQSQRNYYDMSIDPFIVAADQGLHYSITKMNSCQLGRIDLVSKEITLNESGYSNYDRLRFTMAHEIGHYLLHSPMISDKGIISFGDTFETIANSLTIANGDKMRLEWQANRFAASLLMPKKLVTILFIILHKEFVENVYGDKFGPVYYNPHQRETWDVYRNVVSSISKIFNVSLKAAEIRLIELNFLVCKE